MGTATLIAMTPAYAAQEVDQTAAASNPSSAAVYHQSTNGWFQQPGQLFTAGMTGDLTQVDVSLSYRAPVSDPIVIRVYAVDQSGHPTGAALASQTLASANQPGGTSTITVDNGALPGATEVAFASPASVVAGTQYAIIAESDAGEHSTGGQYDLWLSLADTYARGNAIYRNQSGWSSSPGWDVVFTTYVTRVSSSSRTGDASRSPARFTLTFDANGGRCTVDAVTVIEGTWLELPGATECHRDGHTLIGWNTARAGNDLGFAPGPKGYTHMTGDNSVYAQWAVVGSS